jgi:hypothetical protein
MVRSIPLAAIACLIVLGGCASLSESQCLADDWQTIGYSDGLQGKQTSALLKHQNACIKHGVAPDRDGYLSGWHEGIAQYCQPANGFAVGKRGSGYANVCPEQLQPAFFAAYQDGRQLYLARAEINNLERQIDRSQRQLNKVKSALVEAESLLIDGDLTSQERRQVLEQTKDLAKEQGQLETEIEDMKIEAAVKDDRLQSLRHALTYNSA